MSRVSRISSTERLNDGLRSVGQSWLFHSFCSLPTTRAGHLEAPPFTTSSMRDVAVVAADSLGGAPRHLQAGSREVGEQGASVSNTCHASVIPPPPPTPSKIATFPQTKWIHKFSRKHSTPRDSLLVVGTASAVRRRSRRSNYKPGSASGVGSWERLLPQRSTPTLPLPSIKFRMDGQKAKSLHYHVVQDPPATSGHGANRTTPPPQPIMALRLEQSSTAWSYRLSQQSAPHSSLPHLSLAIMSQEQESPRFVFSLPAPSETDDDNTQISSTSQRSWPDTPRTGISTRSTSPFSDFDDEEWEYVAGDKSAIQLPLRPRTIDCRQTLKRGSHNRFPSLHVPIETSASQPLRTKDDAHSHQRTRSLDDSLVDLELDLWETLRVLRELDDDEDEGQCSDSAESMSIYSTYSDVEEREEREDREILGLLDRMARLEV